MWSVPQAVFRPTGLGHSSYCRSNVRCTAPTSISSSRTPVLQQLHSIRQRRYGTPPCQLMVVCTCRALAVFVLLTMPARPVAQARDTMRDAFDACDVSRPAELWARSVAVNKVRYTALFCCAFCGVFKQGDSEGWSKVPADSAFAPYVIANPIMQEYTEADKNRWWACSYCKKSPRKRRVRIGILPCFADEYIAALLNAHPLQVMVTAEGGHDSEVQLPAEKARRTTGGQHRQRASSAK